MTKYSELFRLLKRNGWVIIRHKGSHVMLRHPEKSGQLTIPNHASREVKRGLLKAILKQADIKINK